MRISIKAARANANLKQEEMASALNVTRQTISSWEKGKSLPTAGMIDPICTLLGVKYDDIQWKIKG